jgi:hypothetical protein
MKLSKSHLSALVSLLAAFAAASPATALTLRTSVLSIYQVGTGPQVKLGHVVEASTNFSQLTAGGDFIASCADPAIMPSTGSRTLSASNLVGGLYLAVTIPRDQPAYVNMSGFYGLPRGSVVSCTYMWTSHAVEGGIAISASGVSIQSGNGRASEGGTRPFSIRVPSGTDPNENSSCIP